MASVGFMELLVMLVSVSLAVLPIILIVVVLKRLNSVEQKLDRLASENPPPPTTLS